MRAPGRGTPRSVHHPLELRTSRTSRRTVRWWWSPASSKRCVAAISNPCTWYWVSCGAESDAHSAPTPRESPYAQRTVWTRRELCLRLDVGGGQTDYGPPPSPPSRLRIVMARVGTRVRPTALRPCLRDSRVAGRLLRSKETFQPALTQLVCRPLARSQFTRTSSGDASIAPLTSIALGAGPSTPRSDATRAPSPELPRPRPCRR